MPVNDQSKVDRVKMGEPALYKKGFSHILAVGVHVGLPLRATFEGLGISLE